MSNYEVASPSSRRRLNPNSAFLVGSEQTGSKRCCAVVNAGRVQLGARHNQSTMHDATSAIEPLTHGNRVADGRVSVSEARFRRYGFTVLFVLLATGVGWLGRRVLLLPDLAILYLYVIVVPALLFGWGPAIVATVLSVVAYDFFFVPPIFEFNVYDLHFVVTFAMMFLVGLLVSQLAARIRREQHGSVERERRTSALFSLSRALGSATDETHVAGLLVRHTAAAFGVHAAQLMPDSAGALYFAAKTGDVPYQSEEQLAVASVHKNGQVAGDGTEIHPDARIACVPIPVAGTTVGVLVVEYLPNVSFSAELREMLESFGRLGGACIGGLRLAEAVTLAEIRARTEAVRSALLSAVSHDLRTPLAVITEAATMLRDDVELLSPVQRAEMVVTVCDEAERMDRQVANLLDMTRLESGGIVLTRDWVPCEELVGAALNIVKSKVANLTIRTHVPSDLTLVAVDPSLIEQLLANVFENAAKYAGPHATVDVTACAVGGALVIEIADDGPGIPVGTEERIFEKFFRASPMRAGGTGLGLAICRAIIEIHGGTISAANRRSG